MPYNIRIVSTYPPRRCGIGTFSRDLATALAHFTAEVGHIRVAAIDSHHGPYGIPVDLSENAQHQIGDPILHLFTRPTHGSNPSRISMT